MKERCLCALCRYADEVDAHLAQLAEPQRAFFVDMYERLCNAENDLDWERALARIGTDFPCDSGSGPKGEDAPAAECEASQSGDAEGSASPNPILSGDSPNG